MLTLLFIVAVSTAAVCARSLSNNLVVTRQDSTNAGQIQQVDVTTGSVLAVADPSFVFSFPHVEMTSDSNTGDVYVVTFPVDAPGPVLFQLDHDLNVTYTWKNVPYSFFDLQYSPNQKTLYGIKVTTTYGRVLSNFTTNQAADSVTATELYTLPYMWYVNASSFDPANSRYFALINNFPGFENSTLDQQLIVADFSQNIATTQPAVGLFPIDSQNMLVQFVTYSHSLKTLFCAGMTKKTSSGAAQAEVAIMDQTSGTVTKRVFSKTATAVGPLMYVPNGPGRNQLTVYIQTATQPVPVWELWSLTVHSDASVESTLVQTYSGTDFKFFAGAAVSY